jgi:hypothetical protein
MFRHMIHNQVTNMNGIKSAKIESHFHKYVVSQSFAKLPQSFKVTNLFCVSFFILCEALWNNFLLAYKILLPTDKLLQERQVSHNFNNNIKLRSSSSSTDAFAIRMLILSSLSVERSFKRLLVRQR